MKTPANPEDLASSMVCAHGDGDGFVDETLLAVDDENNASIAKYLLDCDLAAEKAAAHFGAKGQTVEDVSIWGFDVNADELDGGWDLTLHLGDPNGDVLQRLAPLTKSRPIDSVVGKYVYDLTSRATTRSC